ncbi:branched-chain amino acid ABC transporter permease [Streptomyces sp. NBC_00038]|uniref:branched-chain amino acid ABC transporter permease n=1 Tax=Streptomyces sp. NBC_00038 TaxID=2903615 RepID=UPI002255B175|nr:branched-chain amino acid ABC transporter permease [Streptomyces sp. NBC_00038]MCX5554709.1 branched-chain amino acid ABC transporter permease [Streptomyces sp. NBC_00038]
MSDSPLTTSTPPGTGRRDQQHKTSHRPAAAATGSLARSLGTGRTVTVAVLAVLLVLPFYLESFWLQLGLFIFATAVAALGMTLLLGQVGMLSLGHAFFVALGAYGYTYFAADGVDGAHGWSGLGLPPVLAAVLAVGLAGVAGLLFSPVAARLRGIYLGIASLGLVYVGQHVLVNAETLTGGVNGRDVPGFSALGLNFEDTPGQTLFVLGVPFQREERLWYLALGTLLAALVCYRLLVRSRTGRALRGIRDHEVAAAVMGVDVVRYKAYAFLMSSMFAAAGGVLLALAFRRIIPETFGAALSIEYLAMVVIGGIGSASGAAFGAAFVTSLPPVLERYATQLQGAESTGGLSAAVIAKFVYGAAIVLVIIFQPGGMASVGTRIRRIAERRRVRRHNAPEPTT